MLVVGVVVALLLASAQGPAEAQTSAQVMVTASVDGQPVEGIGVDLFGQGPRGNRGPWLRSTATGPDGRTIIPVEPDCYVVTVIAPDGFDFGPEGRWANRATCLGEGESFATEVDLRPAAPFDASIVAEVDRGGVPVSDVMVELFAQSSDGSRGRYLGSRRTESYPSRLGQARFPPVAPGCYVVTFVAPAGQGFDPDRTAWSNQSICVGGEEEATVSASLAVTSTITGSVTFDGAAVAGVQVDLFTSDTDGNRWAWMASRTTGDDGTVVLPAGPDCWVVTFIAPIGLQFDESGTPYVDRSICLDLDESWVHPPVVLTTPPPDSLRIVGGVRTVGDGYVDGVAVDLFAANADGSRGAWHGQEVTSRGNVEFVATAGCWVLTFIAPDGSQFAANESGWINRFFCVPADARQHFETVQLEPAGAPDLAAPATPAPRIVITSWTVDGVLGRWEGGIYQPPMLSHDGGTAAFGTGTGRDDRGLTVRDLETGAETIVVDGVYSIEVVDISNDGRGVLYRQRSTSFDEERLVWWAADRTVVLPSELERRSVNLSADGATVAGLSPNGVDGTVDAVRYGPDGELARTPLPRLPGFGGNATFSDDNRYLAYQESQPEEGSTGPDIRRIDLDTGTIVTLTVRRGVAAGLVELADDDDLIRLAGVGLARFSTGEITLLDYGANLGWFTYAQDFDLSGDGSTFLYPQISPGPLFAVYRPATGEILGIPFQGEEDHASMSGDGTRFLVGEPLTDTTYRLTVLRVPHGN